MVLDIQEEKPILKNRKETIQEFKEDRTGYSDFEVKQLELLESINNWLQIIAQK